MAVNKEHREFYQVDVTKGWETPPGYPAGIQQKILSGKLDPANRRGGHTRLLRFLPGTYSTKPFVHDYWEEVFVISGDRTRERRSAVFCQHVLRAAPRCPPWSIQV